jgi:Zn-dependent M28 family amino/carboxypeptidase
LLQTYGMKFLLLAVILLASCGAALPLQTPKQAEAGKTTAAPASKTLDSAQLLEDVRVLSADSMEGRGMGTKGGAMARAYVARRFADAGLKPLGASFEQTFEVPSRAGGAAKSGVNLVGYVKGDRHPERFIVVTAHYDHLGVREGVIYNGADDNASGVAVLLQLAARTGGARRPENSIIFAALDAEELGLVGARALVKQLQAEKRDLALNVNLDMVSRSDRGELYVAGAHATPALRPLLERVAARAPVKLLLGHDRPEQGHDDWTNQSDQFAFHKAGVPFIYFGVEDHKDYHKPTDDFEAVTTTFFIHAAETILDAVETLDKNLSTVSPGGRRG